MSVFDEYVKNAIDAEYTVLKSNTVTVVPPSEDYNSYILGAGEDKEVEFSSTGVNRSKECMELQDKAGKELTDLGALFKSIKGIKKNMFALDVLSRYRVNDSLKRIVDTIDENALVYFNQVEIGRCAVSTSKIHEASLDEALGVDQDKKNIQSVFGKRPVDSSSIRPILKGKFVNSYGVIHSYDMGVYDGGESKTTLIYYLITTFYIPVSEPLIVKAVNIFSYTDPRSINTYLSLVYTSLIRSKKISRLLDPEFEPKNPVPEGLYRLGDGKFISLPDSKEAWENYKERRGKVTDLYELANMFIGTDYSSSCFFYTDGDGRPSIRLISGITPVTDKDLYIILNKNIEFLTSNKGNSLGASYDWFNNLYMSKFPDLFNDIHVKTMEIHALNGGGDKPEYVYDFITAMMEVDKSFFSALNTTIEDRKISLYNKFLSKGILFMLDNAAKTGNYKKVTEKFNKQKEAFKAATNKDAPPVPGIDSTISMFPHQAQCLAQLNTCDETAILDVSTGGGKTLMAITDALNLMQQKKIKRPLVVMPPTIIPQYYSQVKFFTNNSINVVVITSETYTKHGEERLQAICDAAPPNTIFVSSYSFIANGTNDQEVLENGEVVREFPGVEKIVKLVHPDYVLLDESHYIKNDVSSRTRAMQELAGKCKYRRIATGTLISNNAIDLIGQLGFLDPNIVGSESEFLERYYNGGKRTGGTKENFAELIREDLRKNANYCMFREKDWAWLLPKIEYSYHFIEMTVPQIKMYKSIVKNTFDEIKGDEKLYKAFMKMMEEGEELSSISPQILAKMSKLEQYLTAPDSNELLKYDTGENKVSCKMKKIDELITKSIAQNGKVIVATHYEVAARHLMEHSEYKPVSVYYDASNKKAVNRFIKDPECKVLFSIVNSLAEGLNLTMANRIIIADVDWTPGKLKQLEGRIFRPSIKLEGNGKYTNKNDGKVVYVDTVLCNDSADVVKFCFQTFKKLNNSAIMENSPITIPERVGWSEEVFTARFDDPIMHGNEYMDSIQSYNNWLDKEIQEVKNSGKFELIATKTIPDGGIIGTDKIDCEPWVKGIELPTVEGEKTFMEVLKTEGFDEDSPSVNLKAYDDKLLGSVVRTEFGVGTITRFNRVSVNVNVNGESYTLDPSVLIVTNEKVTKTIAIPKIKVPKATSQYLEEFLAKEAAKRGLQLVRGRTRGNSTVIDGKAFKWRMDTPNGRVYSDFLDIVNKSDWTPEQWIDSMNSMVDMTTEIPTTVKPEAPGSKPVEVIKTTEQLSREEIKLEAAKYGYTLSSRTYLDNSELAIVVKFKGVDVATLEAEKETDFTLAEWKKFFKDLKPEVSADEVSNVKDGKVKVLIGMVNGVPSLVAYQDDPDSEDLKSLGFIFSGAYYSRQIDNKNEGLMVLGRMKDKYEISHSYLGEIQLVLDSMSTKKFHMSFMEENGGVRNWLLDRRRKRKGKELDLYPYVEEDRVYFVVDKKSHPEITGLTRFGFSLKPGFYMYMGKNKSDFNSKWKALNSKFKVTNKNASQEKLDKLVKTGKLR